MAVPVVVAPSSAPGHSTADAMVIGPEGFTEVTEMPIKTATGSGTNMSKPAGSVSDSPAPTPVPVPPIGAARCLRDNHASWT